MPLHEIFDARHDADTGARLFTCGDIHGCYDELMAGLDAIGFDKTRDHLLALGDLVDRGPKNLEVLALLDEPWFHSIRGNHEELTFCAAESKEAVRFHVQNGGQWFADLDDDERNRIAQTLRALPLAMTVYTATGGKYGLVHADLPFASWDSTIEALEHHEVQKYVSWKRENIRRAQAGHELGGIWNVDAVYMGHTPVDEPVRSANMNWIDTKCFRTGVLTIEELK
ncbi:metallophosphoesterase [Croceicoccus gelatinilyticus]|uniref:metallophosphoesterase n=1 Tax=Croceicoccus gelatinilyticus TaxID=2835536 RepID=UPI001BCD8CAD|nr:metallophosphoesterase [Croceicoccus gelatinilyticus]MBS7671617.1 metallophosphoesterase [Croceicoccus gelatinilyticus]